MEEKKKEEFVKIPKKELDYILKVCRKLEKHIEFIDNTYETVRSPLNWICQKIGTSDNMPPAPRQIKENED